MRNAGMAGFRSFGLLVAGAAVACGGRAESSAAADGGGGSVATAGAATAGAAAGGAPNAGGAASAGSSPTNNYAGNPSSGGAMSGSGGSAGAADGGAADGGAGGEPEGSGGAGGGTAPFRILILSTTLEFRHDSIPDCQYMMGLESAKSVAQQHWAEATPLSTAWTADLATDDLAQFTDATLKNYAMVFSCSPTGTVFSNDVHVKDTAAVMAAFQHFVERGGAWAGVHAATDFEKTNGFPWFTNVLAGAYLVSSEYDETPGTVQADPTNATFAALAGVMPAYPTQDEWYNMNRDVSAQPGFKVLQRLAADNRPLTWSKEIPDPSGGMGGRMFYTVRGHNQKVYKESEFRKLVLQGVLWATRRLN